MTVTANAESHRKRRAEGSAPRELPVLFHLMDVSRPPSKAKPAKADLAPPPSFEPETPPEQVIAAPVPVEQIETRQAPLAVEAAFPEPSANAAVAPLPIAELVATPVSAPLPASEEPPGTAIAATAAVSEPKSPPVEPTKETKAVASQPATRATKANQRKTDDWLTAHAKYIALGFVLALVATIYLARTNRGTPAQPVAATHAHPGEAANQPAKQNETKVATVVNASATPAKSKSKAGQAAETSPAKLAEASSAKPQTDLHAPTVPQLVREPAAAPQPRADGLFPWADPAGDRLAAHQTPPAPAGDASSQLRYPVTNPNAALPPNYPPFSPPTGPQPGPGYAPPGGGQSAGFAPQPGNYANNVPSQGQFAAPPGPQQPWTGFPPSPPPAGVPPYQPQDNTARDYRYERTGSGPY